MSSNLPTPPDFHAFPPESDEPLSAGVFRQTADFGDGPAQQKTNWARYFAVINRHKWWIILMTVLGTAAGVIGTRFVNPEYVAQSTLWIEVNNHSDTGPIRDGQLLEKFAWIELLKSYTVLDHVVQKQRLYISPADPEHRDAIRDLVVGERFRPGKYLLTVSEDGTRFVLSSAEGAELQKGKVGEPVGKDIGLIWTPSAEVLRPKRTIEFTVNIPRDVARQLGDQINAQMADHGNFLMLSHQGTDPEQITATLNAVAKRYVEVAGQLKRTKLDELTEILNDQLRQAEQGLRDAEVALESFRVETVTLPSEQASPVAAGLALTQAPVFNNFFQMKIQREQLRQDREAIDRILANAGEENLSLDALTNISAVRDTKELMEALEQRATKRAELRTLLQRYTDEYAPVKRLIEEVRMLEKQTIPYLARGVVARLAAQGSEMEERIGSASGELRQIPPRAIEEARLERQVEIATELHRTLKQRFEVARLAAAGSIPDIRILDEAVVPNDPIGDEGLYLVLFGVLGGFGLGLLGVLARDQLDPRVRYPDQLTSEMGLPVIGMVPHVHKNMDSALDEGTALIAEAFRELRLSVMHAHGTAGPVVFTVSSAEAGDGKSFVASNLALSFAHQGYRTLLMDGDIRRGRLHHLLGRGREPGLTDFLRGTASYEEIVQETNIPSVSFMASGRRLQIGPELLGSSVMTQLLRELRTEFQVIVIDSPPLGAGVDPYILGTVSGNMLLVFRTGNTNRSFATAKLGLLDRLPVRVLGAVMNDVPQDQKAYRYYSYLPGYRSKDDEIAPAIEVASRS